jgi:hypothetical protein
MPELKILFLQMLVILAVAKAVGLLFRLIHQPEVPGEMLAGILLGPSLLGGIAPRVMEELFAPASLGPLYALSQLGLVLFMFLVGLEVHPGLLRQSARSVILASQASLAAPFVCGAILAVALYPPSVITSKPAIGYHLKTGQRNHTQDQMMFYRAGRHSASTSRFRCGHGPGRGIAQGGFQRSALKSLLRGEARSLRRGGNHPRPHFPLGETGMGG